MEWSPLIYSAVDTYAAEGLQLLAMTNLKDLSSAQLQKIISIKSQIEALESELESIASGSAPRRGRPPGKAGRLGRPKGRNMSAAGRKRIAEAAKKRWAAYRSGKTATAEKPAKTDGRKKRKMSAAGRAKIAAAAKARWAKAKAEGKKTL